MVFNTIINGKSQTLLSDFFRRAVAVDTIDRSCLGFQSFPDESGYNGVQWLRTNSTVYISVHRNLHANMLFFMILDG